ncbi:MAG: HD domain-containing phosphohydrolase [Nitrospira sp.]
MRLSDLVREQAPDLPGGPASPQRTVPTTDSRQTSLPSVAQAPTDADWYASAQQEMAKVGIVVRANGAVPIDHCAGLAADVVKRVQAGDALIQCLMAGSSEDYQAANAIHVSILSVKIGIGLHYDSAALEQLALAGLLHDLGMWFVPRHIIEKAGPLDDEERSQISAHPEEGRRIVAGLGSAYHWLATVISQEHERWDGSGYPCKLKGMDITEFAQIVGLADVLDALISSRPYHARIVPHQALRGLLVQHKHAFQPRLIKTVVDQLSLYPVGTAVRLNDGHVGVVSGVNPRYPLRPVLLVHRGHEGRTAVEMVPLDLSHESSIHIVEVLPAAQAA